MANKTQDDIIKLHFRKPMKKIAGTKPSIYNSQQLVTSTGIDSLNSIIGGGLLLGSILLIEEDSSSCCCESLFEHYFAEGIVVGHKILYAVKQTNPWALLKNLPQLVENDAPFIRPNVEEPMKIAWQYQHLPARYSSGVSAKQTRAFDCSKKMEWRIVEKTKPVAFEPEESSELSCYDQVLRLIISTIEREQQSTNRVVRIGLRSLFSNRWWKRNENLQNCQEFCHFLYKLRAVLRSSTAVCCLSVPTHLIKESSLVKRIEQMCDTVIKIESTNGSEKETNPDYYKNYQGLLHVVKLPTLNSQTSYYPSSKEFGIKMRRKRLTFETLYLPPAIDVIKENKGTGCGGSRNSKLDF